MKFSLQTLLEVITGYQVSLSTENWIHSIEVMKIDENEVNFLSSILQINQLVKILRFLHRVGGRFFRIRECIDPFESWFNILNATSWKDLKIFWTSENFNMLFNVHIQQVENYQKLLSFSNSMRRYYAGLKAKNWTLNFRGV